MKPAAPGAGWICAFIAALILWTLIILGAVALAEALTIS